MTRSDSKIVPSSAVSVAPMMDWTNRHCRYFHRLIAPSVKLYTEMVTTGALIHGDRDRFLRFNNEEHPVALQLGGSNPQDLALCAKYGEDAGYDEINLNCGCPSDRVQSGCFGAVLMKSPGLVARCIDKIQQAVNIPVTVKCRIAIDHEDEMPFLDKFISHIADVGCSHFIIHARKAWLSGLSPKENRDIPPLRYDIVAHIKKKYPDLEIVLNGGIKTYDQTRSVLDTFDGAMIGRAAYTNPWILREIEEHIFGNTQLLSQREVILAMADYASREYKKYGTPVKSVARHMIGLFQGIPGARAWRQALSPLHPEKYGSYHEGDGDVLIAIYDQIWDQNETHQLAC